MHLQTGSLMFVCLFIWNLGEHTFPFKPYYSVYYYVNWTLTVRADWSSSTLTKRKKISKAWNVKPTEGAFKKIFKND